MTSQCISLFRDGLEGKNADGIEKQYIKRGYSKRRNCP